jgi:hypothetical protein
MSVESQIKEAMQTAQADARERWNELAQESRQWVTEQVDQLNEQAQQLQAQSRQLRKALRREARQRRQLMTQLSKSSKDFGRDLLKRGGEITQNFLDFGGKTAQDLTERSGEFTQELTKRSSKVTEELTRRAQQLLEPVRRRDRTFWALVGFSVGLVAAGAITYQLVRRLTQQESEQNEHFELPQTDALNGSWDRPMGEIRHIDQGKASVATLEIVNVEAAEKTADATVVGVKSTRLYYPAGTDMAQEDLVYFVTEEEARTQGFRAAE